MTTAQMAPALRALSDDVGDLIAALHLLASAALERGDQDARGALRLLARHGERITERLEELQDAAAKEETDAGS
jgi:hypothetical protein